MDIEKGLSPGIKSQERFTVLEEHCAAQIGSGSVSVLSTPSMIAFMEITARRMLDEGLPDTHTTVGTRVDVRHLAACAIGSQVVAHAEVISVHAKRVVLAIEAWHQEIRIGAGQHERFVIDKQRFLRRLSGV